jgi:hypothetical protein
MSNTGKSTDTYRIEASGWDLNDEFFVEKTDLFWDRFGGKKQLLHHTLSSGAVVFIRLAGHEVLEGSAPLIYQVEKAEPIDSNGQCEMQLRQLHAVSKEPNRHDTASDVSENTFNRNLKESSIHLEREEVLHEA